MHCMRNMTPVKLIAFGFILFLFFLGAESEKDALIFSTKECVLTEPVQGYKFDFSQLHSDLSHQAKSDKLDLFDFNFCGNLTRHCDGQSNVAACLKKGDKEYVLGRQHELYYHNGKMYFNYTNGDACPNSTTQFQLHVFIGCDYTIDQTQAHVTAYADNACSFYITFETPLACLPAPSAAVSNSCSVRDKSGHTYDLLSLSDVNYRTSDRTGNFFIINVCKPVLYGENAMCPAGSSICYFDLKQSDVKKRFKDYGSVQGNPVIENGQLLMRHASATPCNATTNYTSIVYFHCDKNVKNAHPEFVGVHGCAYEFNFVTPLACNDLPACTAVTHGNEILDLSALGKVGPLKLSKDNKNYTFAVCAAAGEPCLPNNGACVTSNSITESLGNVNTHLRFNQSGSPYLLYSDGGAACTTSTSNTYWSTKIEFVCANNATKDNGTGAVAVAGSATAAGVGALAPKIIEDSNCQLLIQYQTALACQEQITCKTKVYVEHSEDGTGEEMVDLTPLISATENYEARIDLPTSMAKQLPKTAKFFLNVCRPLVPKYQLGCAGGSAACMAQVGASGSPEEEHSLGFPMASLVARNRTSVELRYYNGDPCPSDKSTQLSAAIEFYCQMNAGRGLPVLRSIADCHYRFVWLTSVICPPHTCSYNEESCEIVHDDLNRSYNLRKAPYTKDGKVQIARSNTTSFELNICGTHRKALTDYSQDLVNIFFSEKGPCGVDGTVNVQMRLICSNKTERVTSFSDDHECNLLYEQRTPDICAFLGLQVPQVSGKPATSNGGEEVATTPTTTTTTTTTSAAAPADKKQPVEPAPSNAKVGTILAAILSLTFVVVCFGVFAFSPERRRSVRRLFRRTSSAVRYSRVQTNEEANLLLEPNGEFTDSDDDMLL